MRFLLFICCFQKTHEKSRSVEFFCGSCIISFIYGGIFDLCEKHCRIIYRERQNSGIRCEVSEAAQSGVSDVRGKFLHMLFSARLRQTETLAVTALRKGTLDVILMYLAFVFGNIYLVALATTVTEAVSATAACIILIRFLKGFQNQRYSSRDSGRKDKFRASHQSKDQGK